MNPSRVRGIREEMEKLASRSRAELGQSAYRVLKMSSAGVREREASRAPRPGRRPFTLSLPGGEQRQIVIWATGSLVGASRWRCSKSACVSAQRSRHRPAARARAGDLWTQLCSTIKDANALKVQEGVPSVVSDPLLQEKAPVGKNVLVQTCPI